MLGSSYFDLLYLYRSRLIEGGERGREGWKEGREMGWKRMGF